MKKKDYLIKTIFFQIIICSIVFFIILALKLNGHNFFVALDTLLSDKINSNKVVEDVINVFSAQTIEDKNDESKNNASTSTSQQTDDELITDETVFVPFEEPTLSAEIKGSGGADIQIDSEIEIPKNVSVLSYKLNQQMVKPLSGVITSVFGPRIHPISGDLRFHTGIDIAADAGSPIYAAFDGIVEEATYDSWNGYYIKLRHDGNIMSVYCHCEKIKVKKDQVIRAGEIIATVGSTGSSTGPHLHFELRINNQSFNPAIALNEAKNAI
jgi:murein DD-endopeptidase MepM/ murein hydrolase activator NlpD